MTKTPDNMSYRELLEDIRCSQAVHTETHRTLDPMVAKHERTLFGNGKVGLITQIHLLMAASGIAVAVLVTKLSGMW